ncbi:MAG: hypothetical protein ABF968_05030 [Acetobacter sp.]|uniref:hypothetical protein n=1 Tax=Acetobacter sp. TaxID=440 RepID=UPI0039E7DDC5
MKDFQYWIQDVRQDGVPWPRFGELFGDDELSAEEATEICRQNGIELRYWSEEMPDQMVEEGDALEAKYLEQIGRPDWHGTDGWHLVGAFDTEDAEIYLMYARPLEKENA